MDKNYQGLIWTNHVLARMNERGIKQANAWLAWRRPDETKLAQVKGGFVYIKEIDGYLYEVVAKKNEIGKWVILSVWSKPIIAKTMQRPKKKSFLSFLFGGFASIVPLLILSAAALIIILSGTVTFKSSSVSERKIIATNEPTPSPPPSPSPSPSPSATPSPTPTTPPVPTVKPTAQPVVINNAPPGAGYSRQSVSTDLGVFTVSLVAADIGSTRVIIDTASSSDCGGGCPAMALSDYVARSGAFAGINGTYFCPIDYPTCSGKENSFDLLVMNKDKYYFNSGNNVYSSNPAVIFGSGYVRFVRSASEWGRDTSPNGVISNFPLLVFNKEIMFNGDGDPKKGSKGARSFVANKGNTVYIGVTHSATVAESAHVLAKLGMDNAMNLDNGGSTALWYGGYKLGPGRKIPNAILFTR